MSESEGEVMVEVYSVRRERWGNEGGQPEDERKGSWAH